MELKELIYRRLADGAKFIFEWNGYKVYEIVYDRIRRVYKGSPAYALERNGDYRITTPIEGQEIYKIIKDKQRKVYNILLTPIVCDKTCKSVKWEDNKIITGQKYQNVADADMSDFSIGYYKILYNDILDGTNILDNKGLLVNQNFAGDTIYSFNSIANITPNAGKSEAERTDKDTWPSYLREYYESYHCLANFWLLPMKLGRTGTKLNKYDSIDLFLVALKNGYTDISNLYKEYFSCFESEHDFYVKHFISHACNIMEDLYKNKKSKDLVDDAMYYIKGRAFHIAISDKVYELYDYFTRLGVIQQSFDANCQRELPELVELFCPGIRTEIDDDYIKSHEECLKIMEERQKKAAQD